MHPTWRNHVTKRENQGTHETNESALDPVYARRKFNLYGGAVFGFLYLSESTCAEVPRPFRPLQDAGG